MFRGFGGGGQEELREQVGTVPRTLGLSPSRAPASTVTQSSATQGLGLISAKARAERVGQIK